MWTARPVNDSASCSKLSRVRHRPQPIPPAVQNSAGYEAVQNSAGSLRPSAAGISTTNRCRNLRRWRRNQSRRPEPPSLEEKPEPSPVNLRRWRRNQSRNLRRWREKPDLRIPQKIQAWSSLQREHYVFLRQREGDVGHHCKKDDFMPALFLKGGHLEGVALRERWGVAAVRRWGAVLIAAFTKIVKRQYGPGPLRQTTAPVICIRRTRTRPRPPRCRCSGPRRACSRCGGKSGSHQKGVLPMIEV